MRELQLKHTRRPRRKSTPTFMLKLVIHLLIKRYPWLHATPDFLCYCTLCDCCGEGCREVKCPHCLKDTGLKDYPDKSKLCLKSEKGTTNLNQSQEQIFTTGYHYLCVYWTNCFVLWKNSPCQPCSKCLWKSWKRCPKPKGQSCSGTLNLSLSKTPKTSWNKINVLSLD